MEGSEGDIIGTRFARFHPQMAAVVTGPADLRRRAECGAGYAYISVALAEVNSAGGKPFGKRDAVVDDESDIGVGADALQRLGKPGKVMLLPVLDTKLEGRRKTGLERRSQPVRKRPADVLRTDQVQAATARARRGEGVGEIARDLVERQTGTFSVDAS